MGATGKDGLAQRSTWHLRRRHGKLVLSSLSSVARCDGVYSLPDRVTYHLLHLPEEPHPKGTPLSRLSPVSPFRAVRIMQLPIDLSCGYRDM
ncbi:hypothetical protein Droror1_Dr00016405 [Drosera rotundifolia]